MTKLLFTICGRAGSKGIPNKNMRNFLGRPLALYTLSAIDLFLKEQPHMVADIAVSSDSETLLTLFEENGMRKTQQVRRRPELAGDTVGKLLVIRDCMEVMEQRGGGGYDMVVDLDITAPLRRAADVATLIAKKEAGPYDAVFSVTDARRNPWFNMVKKGARGYETVMPSDFKTRQEAPELYDMNASMYAYDPDFLRRAERLFDGDCGIVHLRDTGILDLDHETDFELMEVVAAYLFEKYEDYGAIMRNMEGRI
jgi:CMP-N,N'-diacetyllegionaminic acid synthase